MGVGAGSEKTGGGDDITHVSQAQIRALFSGSPEEVPAQSLPHEVADFSPISSHPIHAFMGKGASPGRVIRNKPKLPKVLSPSSQGASRNRWLGKMNHVLPLLPPLGFKTKRTGHRQEVAIRRRTKGVKLVRASQKGRNDFPRVAPPIEVTGSFDLGLEGATQIIWERSGVEMIGEFREDDLFNQVLSQVNTQVENSDAGSGLPGILSSLPVYLHGGVALQGDLRSQSAQQLGVANGVPRNGERRGKFREGKQPHSCHGSSPSRGWLPKSPLSGPPKRDS